MDYAKTQEFITPLEIAYVLKLNYLEEYRTIINYLYELVDLKLLRVRNCQGLAFEVI